ncbi:MULTISPECIES: alpha/beta fold hydrolase [Methylobacterium]|uniref:alpha/beta fold hydrolase n=1 Tax=Methylobacterium TaxID=407 RepID=UPI0013E9DFF4|nr:alpha/beta hydrolase [Methylobacterium sp. DB0501]NGM37050.1 alpha/beta fold hydrolase [Methylobacterium sp. DB0501]
MPSATINGHRMHYEVHGTGEPVILSGGWGTFCHGGERHLPQGLAERYSVVIFDHRGIGESDDDLAVPATTALYAEDVIGLSQHLGIERAHLVGLIGMGACIMQEVAIRRPELARSMVNTGAWIAVDRFLADQLRMLLDVHAESGFLTFQKVVSLLSFEPDYYARTIDRLLGEHGVWSELNGRVPAHARLIEACLNHDARDRAGAIRAPTLVQHAGLDQVTGPRTTKPIEAAIPNAEGLDMPLAAHVIAGSKRKAEFADALLGFLARH